MADASSARVAPVDAKVQGGGTPRVSWRFPGFANVAGWIFEVRRFQVIRHPPGLSSGPLEVCAAGVFACWFCTHFPCLELAHVIVYAPGPFLAEKNPRRWGCLAEDEFHVSG